MNSNNYNFIQAIINLDIKKIATFLDDDSTHNLYNKVKFCKIFAECIEHLKRTHDISFTGIREIATEILIGGSSHSPIMFEFGNFYFILTIIPTKNGMYKIVQCNALAELDNKETVSFLNYEHVLAIEMKVEAFVKSMANGEIKFWEMEDLQALLIKNSELIDLLLEARYFSSDLDEYAILFIKLHELFWGLNNEIYCKDSFIFYKTLPVNNLEDRINWYRQYEAKLKYLNYKDIDLSQIYLGYFSVLPEYFLNIRFRYKNHEGFIQFLKTFELWKNHWLLEYKEIDYPNVDNKDEVDWYRVCKSLGLLKNQKQDFRDF